MKRMSTIAASALTIGLLALAPAADAQHGPKGPAMKERPMGMGECPMMGTMMKGMMKSGADMSARSERRIAAIKGELAITAAQEAVWETYAAAVKKNVASMQTMHESMMGAATGKTAVERLNAHVSAAEGRIASLKEMQPVLAALYAALSDEQKKKADKSLTGMGCMM